MINQDIQEWGRRAAAIIVRPLAALGISPNGITILGLLLNVVTAWIIATGHVSLGGFCLLAASIFDLFDGALARLSGKSSTFGAFFDSTLDRVAEATIGLGLLFYYMTNHYTLGVSLVYIAMIGSLMVSYARARAEGLGLECKVGLMARPERIIALSIGMIFGPFVLPWILLLLSLLTWITVLQRIVHVWAESKMPRAESFSVTSGPSSDDETTAAHAPASPLQIQS